MTLVDLHGQPTSTLADLVDVDDTPSETIAPARPRDLRPMPGQVIVLRGSVDPYYRNTDGSVRRGNKGKPIEKPLRQIDQEEAANIEAIVARTGPDLGERPMEKAWWKKGDHVVIQPHIFTEVFIAAGASLWIGPFVGIKGVFGEENDESSSSYWLRRAWLTFLDWLESKRPR